MIISETETDMSNKLYKPILWTCVIFFAMYFALYIADAAEPGYDPGVNGSKITNWHVHLAYERQMTQPYSLDDAGWQRAMDDAVVLSFVNGAIVASMRSVAELCSPAYAHQISPNGDGMQLADYLAQFQIEDGKGHETWTFTALDSMVSECHRVHVMLANRALNVAGPNSAFMIGEHLLNGTGE